jgi:predicted nucleic acid-binding protein
VGLILDTGVFIRAERERRRPSLSAPPGEAAGICTITLSELFEGVHLADSAERANRRLAFIEQNALPLPVFVFDAAIAQVHAKLRAEQRRRGAMIGAHDLIIAATAMALGWGVLTGNVAEFSRVEALDVRGM